MQQDPGSRLMRAQKTQSELPRTTTPLAPTNVFTQRIMPQPAMKKRPNHTRWALWQLLGLAVLLEVVYLALYPLVASSGSTNIVARQALLGLFPWLPRLYWTTLFPALAQNVAHRLSSVNVLGLLLALAFVLVLLAARVGDRAARARLSPSQVRSIFSTVIVLTGVFGLTYLCAPSVMSQDVLLYGLIGRMVIVYHVNPYLVAPTAFPYDILYAAIARGLHGPTVSGPIWVDVSILVVLFAGGSVAHVLVGFRLLGLTAHLINVVLIWTVLTKLKPEARIAGTLLYAWNPLVLLMSVAEMHQSAVIVLFVLLAVFLFQRKSLILSWVFLLLAVLTNALSLLLLPLFFAVQRKESRDVTCSINRPYDKSVVYGSSLWGLGTACVSVAVVLLAYAPYWQGWGLAGIIDSLRQAVLQNGAVNSLDAVLLNLPLKLPPAVYGLIVPAHWIIVAAVVVGGLLLFGLWLVDSLRFALLFTSWLFLALLVLLPTYWPWYTLLPLALAICAMGRGTLLLAVLMTMGATLSYYYWFWQPSWPGQALVTVGLPLLLWGWTLFFSSTWQMTHTNEPLPAAGAGKGVGVSRPSRPSHPSWPFRRR